jgi:Domain of unknown function (DUF4124)
MRLIVFSIIICLLLPLDVSAQDRPRHTYSWVDDDGIKHYGDSVPAEYADKPKEVLNEQGVLVMQLEGKKTEEQLAAEAAAAELELQRDLQRRADQALLATYISVAEIEMHRDRRVELFKAQARVTELYLRNLSRRLTQLKKETGRYKPYNSDPSAKKIDPSLTEEIGETETSIARHKNNLQKFRDQENRIIDRFEGDIQRFMIIKGIATGSQSRVTAGSLAQADPE